jgi:hypothetical protein
MNIVVIVLGTLCLFAADLYLPWGPQWKLMKRTPGGIYRAFRAGEIQRRPSWSLALGMLGAGLLMSGLGRLWWGL